MPPNNPDPTSLLNDPEIPAEPVQPEAAIKFWQDKAKLTWAQAQGLSDGAKARAFYVTGLYRQDLVDLVSDALREALENGETLEDFKIRIAQAIQNQGWHDYRIENIFRTNMQSAYSAGRYLKMQAVKKSRPYWQYLAIMDRRTRPSHAVLHELVYPADHDFWSENYPPNGFRCRCCVRSLSERQVKMQDLKVEKEMPGPGIWTDPETGEEVRVNFPGADKGFRNNPFADWASGGSDMPPMLRQNLDKLNRDIAASSIRGIVKESFESWSRNPTGNFPLCVLKETDAEQIGAKTKVAVLSAETYAKQKAHHPELTAEDYALAQEAVDRGEKFQQNPLNLAFVLNKSGGKVVIVKATRDGSELYVTSLYRLSTKDFKRKEEVERLKPGKKKG